MEPSEEIRRVVHRWLVANTEGDADAVMARISEQPGMLAIGTDGDEWWHAAERAVWRRQIEESGGFPVAWDQIEAWEEGSVGWAGMKMTIRPLTGSGDTSEIRATVDEDGRGLVLAYNEANRVMSVVDRQLLLYRKYATTRWPWEELIREAAAFPADATDAST